MNRVFGKRDLDVLMCIMKIDETKGRAATKSEIVNILDSDKYIEPRLDWLKKNDYIEFGQDEESSFKGLGYTLTYKGALFISDIEDEYRTSSIIVDIDNYKFGLLL